MAKGGKNAPGGEIPSSSAVAASSLSHSSTSTMSHASMRPNSSSNGINANISTGSAVSRLSPGTASDERNRVPQLQPSQALPFQSMSNTSTLSQASSLNSTTTTVPRTSGLASLGGGAGQLAHQSSSREAAPETRTSHTSIALSGIQALNNKLSAMTQISPSLAQYYKEELIAHIMGWQADTVEKQASQIAAEGLNIGALNCTRVSGDLKAARSLVRVHDILSTLQEQRLKVVKAWMKDLDYFPHVAGIPFHPPSSSPNSVGIQNGLPPAHSGSLPLTNGLTPFIPPPSSTGVGWGTPSSLPPIPTSGLNTPAEPVLMSPTSSAAPLPPPPLSLPPSLTSPPPPPPPSSTVVKHENIPSADVTANSSSTTKLELNSFKKERSLSSSNDSTPDPHRPTTTQSTQQLNPPSSSSRRMSGGINDSTVVGVKHKMEQSAGESTPIDSEERKCGNESQVKTKLKAEVKVEVKTELKVETEINLETTTTTSDVSTSRSRSNSGDDKTNLTVPLKIDSGQVTLDPSCRDDDDDECLEDEAIPALKKTKLNNGEAVRKEGNERVTIESESTSLEPAMDHSLERSADAAGHSSDSCLIPSPMDRRSASPDEACRPKLSLDGENVSADAVVAEGSPANDISATDLIPNGNLGDDRLAPSPTTVVAN